MLHGLYHALAWTWGGDGQGGPNGDGYLITSGPLAASAVIGAVVVWLLGLRCEATRCWRRARRENGEGERLCLRHYRAGLPPEAETAIEEVREAAEAD